MPIIPIQQITSIEDKFEQTLRIISTMKNVKDADFIRNFIFDISNRYVQKYKELELHTGIGSGNDSELDYFNRILNELGY